MLRRRFFARSVEHGKFEPNFTMPPVSVNQNFVERL